MTLHEDLTRVIEEARDLARKNYNVLKESYGQYLARAILASDVIAQVRAETLREAHADFQAYTDAGAPHGHQPIEEFLLRRADRIEREAGI